MMVKMTKRFDMSLKNYGNRLFKSISLLSVSILSTIVLCLSGCASSSQGDSAAGKMGGLGKTAKSNPPIRISLENGKIISIPLEKYLLGVMSKEVPVDWPLEALKAQAVASRTYAVYRRQHPRNPKFDVSATTADQVFDKKRHYPEPLIEAIQETKGEVLTYQGEAFEAFFHSTCGGASEKASHVWEGDYPPPVEASHADPFCSAAPHDDWTYTVSEETLENILRDKGYALPKDWNIGIDRSDEFGRVQTLTIESSTEGRKKNKSVQTLNANTLREMVGYSNLHSTLFVLSEDDNGIVFTGKGSGHGVGLCQWGAKGQAEDGKNYRDILNFYYPGADLMPLDQKLIIKESDTEKLETPTAPTPPPSSLEDTTPETTPPTPPNETPVEDPKKSSTSKKPKNGIEAVISNLPDAAE